MKALLFSALLDLDIDCNEIFNLAKNENTQWKQDICRTYFSDYSNVKMKAIRNISKKVSATVEKNLEAAKPIAGRLIVKRVTSDTGADATLITTFYVIDAFQEVWVASKNIKKNTVLDERDITKVIKNVGRLIGLEQFPDLPPKGSFIEKSLVKGQIIYSSHLSVKPLIETGKQIKVIFISGNLKINTQAVALDNGFIADAFIKVRLLDTGKILTGKIKDNETITADL